MSACKGLRPYFSEGELDVVRKTSYRTPPVVVIGDNHPLPIFFANQLLKQRVNVTGLILREDSSQPDWLKKSVGSVPPPL